MHFLFALSGLHRVPRGAEVVLENVANEIAREGEHEVTVIGSGEPNPERSYHYSKLGAVARETFDNWPQIPFFRNECTYEEATFAWRLKGHPALKQADVTLTCGYPWTSWFLRTARKGGQQVPHVFVTQNGDWPAATNGAESRFFSCEGLICTNPVYFERNKDEWNCTLIPNGVSVERFTPGPSERSRLGLPEDKKLVLMVSALQDNKRVADAIGAVGEVDNAFLFVAGDGPLRDEIDALAAKHLPGRFKRGLVPHESMPALYRSADIFLHTTIGESFGNVYIEALSCGTPLVVHDEPITRWILGDFGTLVDTTSHDALVQGIKRGLSSAVPGDGSVREFVVDNYSWQSVATRYGEFLEQVAAIR